MLVVLISVLMCNVRTAVGLQIRVSVFHTVYGHCLIWMNFSWLFFLYWIRVTAKKLYIRPTPIRQRIHSMKTGAPPTLTLQYLIRYFLHAMLCERSFRSEELCLRIRVTSLSWRVQYCVGSGSDVSGVSRYMAPLGTTVREIETCYNVLLW